MFFLTLKRLKFFTVLLSTFALLHLQIGTVYAQADANSIQQDRANRAGVTSSSSEGGSGQQVQPAKRTKEVNVEETSMGMGDMIYFLVLIGMSLFVMSLWRYSPMTLDMRIAMGAATVMLGAELVTIFQTMAKIDAGTYQVEVQEDGTVNNMQVDALKKQKESYESLAKYAALKWKIQMAGAAAYAVAGTMAYIQFTRIKGKSKACLTGLTTNGCVIAANIYAKDQISFMTPLDSKIKGKNTVTNTSALVASIQSCTGPPPKTPADAIAAANLACKPYLATKVEEPVEEVAPAETMWVENNLPKFNPTQQSYALSKPRDLNHSSPLVVENQMMNVWNWLDQDNLSLTQWVSLDLRIKNYDENDPASFYDEFINLLIPKAHAFDLSKMGIGAAAVIVIIALARGSYKWMDRLIMNPSHRAMIYGATAAAAGVAAMITMKAQGQAEDNIKKIDEMLARFDRLQKMKVANLEKRFQNTSLSGRLEPQDFAGTPISTSGRSTACPPNVGEEKTTCRSFEKEIKESGDIGSLGNVMGNMAVLSGRVADGFTGTDNLSAGTIADIDNLASQNALANRALRQIQDQVNEANKANGDKTIDFKAQEEQLLKAIAGSIKSELGKGGLSPAAAVANMGSSVLPPDPNAKSSEDDLNLETTKVAAKGGANMDNVKAPDFNFSFGDEELEEVGLDDGFEYSDDMYAKAFEENQATGGTSQIVGNRDVSLFQVISVRYMKSGLPRLLEEQLE